MKNKIKKIIFIFFLSINLQADLIGIPGEIIAIKLNEKINAGKLNKKFGLSPTKNIGYIWKDVCNKSFKCPYYNKRCICQSVMYSN